MIMLAKFKISKNHDNSFTVESRVSGNKVTVEPSISDRPNDVLLWTILDDLHKEVKEGCFGDSL